MLQLWEYPALLVSSSQEPGALALPPTISDCAKKAASASCVLGAAGEVAGGLGVGLDGGSNLLKGGELAELVEPAKVFANYALGLGATLFGVGALICSDDK